MNKSRALKASSLGIQKGAGARSTLNDSRLMNPNTAKNLIVRNAFLCAAAIAITSCGTATFSKTGSDAQIESLRNFELAFIDEFAVPGKRFNAAAFDAKVNEGNAKFQQAIADEKFTARRPVLVDLGALQVPLRFDVFAH